jgi:hypothetical protein
MLKDLKLSLCGDIGLPTVVLSGLGSRRTHPYGVEGASMARTAPFPLSSIPAYIEHSMKVLCVLRFHTQLREPGMLVLQLLLHCSCRRFLRQPQ